MVFGLTFKNLYLFLTGLLINISETEAVLVALWYSVCQAGVYSQQHKNKNKLFIGGIVSDNHILTENKETSYKQKYPKRKLFGGGQMPFIFCEVECFGHWK